jgi:molybdopterin-guanine dinucleotide biosynthesis protein A
VKKHTAPGPTGPPRAATGRHGPPGNGTLGDMTRPDAPPAPPWVAVVLAGGTSRRWAGRDKTAATLRGEPLLRHAVRGVLPAAAAVAVVAPAEHPARPAIEADLARVDRPLVWTREDPPGTGPVAGLAAGLAALGSGPPAPVTGPAAGPDRLVAAVAGDLPFARTAWPRLVAALAEHPPVDAALGVDPSGRSQPLLAVYRERALRDRLAAGPVAGRALRTVTEGLAVLAVPVSAVEAFDLDTAQDAAAAEQVVPEGSPAAPGPGVVLDWPT